MPDRNKLTCLLLLLLIGTLAAVGQPRTKISLNSGWRFSKGDAAGVEQNAFNDSAWQRVNIPHTWNLEDPWDDEPGYYRGRGWYRRALTVPTTLAKKRLYLYIEGANQVADVFVNGQKAGSHTGGYSAFAFDVTNLLKTGRRNVIAVRVDNSFNEDIPPLTADFNFYGGIYRDVWLFATDNVHFDVTDHASSGIRITTPDVASGSGKVVVEGTIVNDGTLSSEFEVVTTILNSAGRKVSETSTKLNAADGIKTSYTASASVPAPKLWSSDSPLSLYGKSHNS